MGFFQIRDPRKIEAVKASKLVYRERGGSIRRVLGLSGIVLGTLVLVGMVQMLSGWSLFNIGVNVVFGGWLLAWGFATLVDLGVILDIDAGSVVFWWGPGFPLSKTTRDLEDFDRVELSSRVQDAGMRTFPVRLVGPGERPLELFCPLRHSQAEALARELATFLHLPATIWQPEQGELKRTEAFLRHGSSQKGMGRVTTSRPSAIAYEQRFPAFLRLWGVVASPMGFIALLSPLWGFRFEDKAGGGLAPAWLGPCLGTIFLLSGLLFLLGRRGITIDGRSRLLTRWCGIPFRFWATHHDLEPFRAVALARELRTHDALVIPAYHVLFSRPDGASLKVFDFVAEEEARARADELAAFLGLELRGELEAEDRRSNESSAGSNREV